MKILTGLLYKVSYEYQSIGMITCGSIELVFVGSSESYYVDKRIVLTRRRLFVYCQARVFSYLIGDEVTSSNKYHVRWLACANKGMYVVGVCLISIQALTVKLLLLLLI